MLLALSRAVLAEDFEFRIPVALQSSGSYHVSGSLGSNDAVDFLIDTGAGMAVLTEATFKSLPRAVKSKPSKRVAVRLADGRTRAVDVYTVEQLVLGQSCNVGPLDVAVIPGATKNILGMDVLNKAAPFAIYTSPPALALSVCVEHAAMIATSNDSATTHLSLLQLLGGN